jgi:hypothetical protein
MFSKNNKPAFFETTAMPCGTKFIVGTETKDTTFPTGSMGYTAFALGPDCKCPNVMFYNTVVIRRGKGGKWRVEQNMLLAPIFILPDTPLEFTVPPSDERKHFIDMVPCALETMDLTNQNSFASEELYEECIHSYLGHVLAKSLFLKELDSATKPIDHPLMKKLELNGDRARQRVFNTKQKSVLRNLVSDIEGLVRDRQYEHISDMFWKQSAQETLFKELRSAEVALTLPSLEYSKKVNGVLLAAIEYVQERLNSSEGKALPNHKMLHESAKITAQAVKAAEKRLSQQIASRLQYIVDNRELVKSEVPSPAGLSIPSEGKVTHVFSGHQS